MKKNFGKDIYFAGGCFWGTEHYFKQIEGVMETSVGFANGHTDSPTYKEVYTDTTDYDWNVGGGSKRNAFIRTNNALLGINPNIHGFKTFYYCVGTLRR